MLGAWIVTILPLGYAALASFFILWPADSTVSGYGVSRFTYELTQLIPLAIIFLLTIVFFVWGQAEKRNQDVVIELAAGSEELAASAGGE